MTNYHIFKHLNIGLVVISKGLWLGHCSKRGLIEHFFFYRMLSSLTRLATDCYKFKRYTLFNFCSLCCNTVCRELLTKTWNVRVALPWHPAKYTRICIPGDSALCCVVFIIKELQFSIKDLSLPTVMAPYKNWV